MQDKLFINEEWIASVSNNMLDVVNPSSENVVQQLLVVKVGPKTWYIK